jgi:hypothetical protein
MLAEHPEIMDRLRKEILDTVGSSKMPVYDDLRGMKYMRAFINGVLIRFNSGYPILNHILQKH